MPIQIKPATEQDSISLNQHLPTNIPNFHEKKIKEQDSGNNVWLIAWEDNIPVGHIQVRFDGMQDSNYVKQFVNGYAHIESLRVKEEYRNQGIGTQLILESEKLAKQKGLTKIGIAVGETDNPNARKLYEKMGYKEWDKGTFNVSWTVKDKSGQEITETEKCIYLIKTFN